MYKVNNKILDIGLLLTSTFMVSCSNETINDHIINLSEAFQKTIEFAEKYPKYRTDEEQQEFNKLVSSAKSFNKCLDNLNITRSDEELERDASGLIVDISNYSVLLTKHIDPAVRMQTNLTNRWDEVTYVDDMLMQDRRNNNDFVHYNDELPINNKICSKHYKL